jgi:S-adenosylmethionine synthetase
MATATDRRSANHHQIPTTATYTFTSESVAEGHPDKVCDYIADSVLDAHLEGDPSARVACEVLCKANKVVLAGEITSRAHVDHESVARNAIREIGYIYPDQSFHADSVEIQLFISQQTADIAQS